MTSAYIAPNSSAFFKPDEYHFLPSGFKGSVKVESVNGKEIGASVNEHSSSGLNTQSMSYRGFMEGDKKSYLPNITKKYFKWTTTFSIQNISKQTANVIIKFYKKGKNSPSMELSRKIKQYASIGINPNNYEALQDGWQGSVVIESQNDKDIIAIVNEHHDEKGAMSYRGFRTAESANRFYLPNINKKYFKWTTPFIVQNIDSSSANVVVKFYRNNKNDAVKTIKDVIIKPGTSIGFNPDNIPIIPSNWKGSVVVETQGNKKIIAVVNEHNLSGDTMSYNGTRTGGKKSYLPNINTNNYDWYSTFSTQNLGSKSTEVTINFYDIYGRKKRPPLKFDIAPKKMIGINTNHYIYDGFRGSVYITTSDGNIFTTVNQHRNSIDDSMSYDGFYSN